MTNRYRQRPGRGFFLALMVLIALVLAAGFYLGQRAAHSAIRADPDSSRNMQLQLSAVREDLKAVQGDLEVQRTLHDVDREALELVRREMTAQRERTADLEEGLRFYRGLMAPGEVASGLSVRRPELVAHERPGRYAYRIVVQQEARKHELLEGSVSVEVFGLLGEEQVSYPLSQLSNDMGEEGLPLHFRYFQAIEGVLTLPDGLEPTGMAVLAITSKPRKAEVREQFPWQVQERFIHVGK